MSSAASRGAFALAFLLMPIPALAQDEPLPARPAKVFTVAETSALLELTYPAIVLPSREVELSFRVSGRVIDLPVRAAMDVQEGDVIAQLDPRDFEIRIAQLESQRDQADAQLRALRAGGRPEEIASLEANVQAAEAQVEQARDQVERSEQLTERGVVSTAQLDQDRANLRVAEAQLDVQLEQLAIGRTGGRQEDIDAAEAALRGIEAQLDEARSTLDDATLRAPFTGIVARRDIENFTNVQAGQSIVLLQRLAVVHLVFDVPAPDVSAVAEAGFDNVTNKVTFDALPGQIFDGEVVEFSTQADSATQTYRGRIAVTIPEDVVILPGMAGQVINTAPIEAGVLMVPLTAVGATADGSPVVWLVGADQTVTRQAVTLGAAAGDSVSIMDGLSAGDMIVSAGVGQLSEGMTIRPVSRIGG